MIDPTVDIKENDILKMSPELLNTLLNYKKHELADTEITFIESMINPL